MSATFATMVRPEVPKRPGSFSQVLRACWGGIASYFARRAAIASLHELDDRALRDIGLTRSQVEPAVDGLITPSDRARM